MKTKLFHRNFSLLIAGQASSLFGNGILADRGNKRNIMAGLDFLASFGVLLAALFMREGNSLAIICYWEAWSIQLLD